MRVVSGEQMADIDRRTIEQIGIPAEALMENAGLAVAKAGWEMLHSRRSARRQPPRVVVVAGRGNNGADGCVAARHLANWGARVRVYRPEDNRHARGAGSRRRNSGAKGKVGRELAGRQFDVLPRMGIDVTPVGLADLSKVKLNLAMADLVIDALLGTGFRGEPEGVVAALIDAINEAGAPAVAVDLPSGVDASSGGAVQAVKADVTVTFGLPKVGTLLFPGAEYQGEVRVVDIGFPRQLLDEGADLWWLKADLVRTWLPARPAHSHKGTYGHVLIAAGSREMAGAGHLAVRGAHRAGAGLVTWAVPAALQATVAAHTPETITTGASDGDEGLFGEDAVDEVVELANARESFLIGPGLGRDRRTLSFVRGVLAGVKAPTVIDADGLYALASAQRGGWRLPPETEKKWVLTPHPGEMARLMDRPVTEVTADALNVVREAATRFRSVVILKGARTLIAAPDGRAWVNSTGNPALATGGTGDVLAGVVASLLAQGCPSWQAAAAGVFLHGLAGDLAVREVGGQAGLLAREVADRLPEARGEVLKEGERNGMD